jgi:hypothetical protein
MTFILWASDSMLPNSSNAYITQLATVLGDENAAQHFRNVSHDLSHASAVAQGNDVRVIIV